MQRRRVVRKNPLRIYKKLGLEMYQAGFNQEQVKQALKANDLFWRRWQRTTRDRDAGRLANRIWDLYGEIEAQKILEKTREREEKAKWVDGRRKFVAYPGEKLSRQEEANKWLLEFLGREENKTGRMGTHIVSLGKAEHGFAPGQIYNAINKWVDEGKLEKERVQTGKQGGAILIKKCNQ